MALPLSLALPTYCPPTEHFRRNLSQDPAWLADVKVDGWRCLVCITPDGAVFWSRQGKKISKKVPGVRGDLAGLLPTGSLIDCELECTKGREFLTVFDVLQIGARYYGDLALGQRRMVLHNVIPTTNFIAPVKSVRGDLARFYDQTIKAGGEGIVIKRINSPYPAGRSLDWLKIKERD